MKQTSSCLRAPGILFLLLLFSISVFGQTITVKGTVKDASSATLPGVNVRIHGSSTGTITDVDGKFSIQVPSNAKLEFSFVGYTSQLISVSGKTVINVTLAEDTKALSEVVVVGYGTQRKEAVTGSVASVNGNALKEIPAANVTNALQGRVAGVDLEQTDTHPGATLQIRIRGTRSLTATNDPLIVLDGIPFSGTLSDISPNDIKSIDILKDASATAIYGSRGANGVILITTNKGVKGSNAQISYNGYVGVGKAIYYPMMNGSEFVALRKASGRYTTNGTDESNDVNTNWQSLFYTTAMTQSHDVNVTGGNEKGSYKFGANYFTSQAAIPGQNYTRYAIRGSLDQGIGKYIHVGFTTNTNFNITNGASLGMYGVLSMSPIANPYNTDGSLKRIVNMVMDNQYVYTKSGINNLGDTWKDQKKGFGSYNSFYGEINIPGVEGLKYRTNIGANFNFTNAGTYTGVGVMSSTSNTVSSASLSNSYDTDWAIENMFTYDRAWKKHRVNAVAMFSAEQNFYNSTYVSAQNIPADNLQFYNLGQSAASDITMNPSYQGYTVWGLESWMGRVMYSYDDRYMISVTGRSDGSSRLASGHQWHTYPAVSMGWNIHKESFMKNITWLDELKVRAGYGETSNQAVNAYSTLGSLATSPYNFGTSYLTGYYVNTLPNPKLGWEFSKTENFGADFAVLKNRLTGTFEYYITDTKNLLLGVNLPSTTGVGSYTANVGSTQNKGFELSLNGVILENYHGWTWELGVNMYHNVNKITSLASGQTEDKGNGWFVGHSINSIYDYKKVGLWNTSDKDYKYLQTLEPGGVAGMIKVQYTGTYNADGSPTRAIGAADMQVQNLDPNLQGGFHTRVAYKGFDLSLVGSFQCGGTLISTLYGSAGYLNMLTGRRGNIKVDYWTPTNTNASFPNPAGPLSGDNPKYGQLLGYFSASYAKVRTITLGYDFTQKWLKYAGIEKLRVYGTVQNPFVLFSPYHKESGMDPETNSYGDSNSAVSSYNHRILTVGFNTPTTHTYLLGINVTF
ncbi:TonB-dependent receptor [Paludibacter sp.]|uniref:SusC/RagA family TonB-linked outer membrane protein n=1 Tax=Paludibacter sp. TaxID=1898105 RepID=UPI001352ADDF|nr:TonB-dependent receptor [Paludibacter sp.]MTK53918.1 TonB-dependent receptor [Paludibacter sp.]